MVMGMFRLMVMTAASFVAVLMAAMAFVTFFMVVAAMAFVTFFMMVSTAAAMLLHWSQRRGSLHC